MKIEIVQTDADQPWHARLVGDNGEKVWWTEQYARRADAIGAVTLVAELFGARGRSTVEGPPGNALLVFRRSAFGQTATASEVRYPLYDVDERSSQ